MHELDPCGMRTMRTIPQTPNLFLLLATRPLTLLQAHHQHPNHTHSSLNHVEPLTVLQDLEHGLRARALDKHGLSTRPCPALCP